MTAGWSTKPAASGALPRTRWYRTRGAPADRPRVAAQRAFWFGWYAQYPDTTLIK